MSRIGLPFKQLGQDSIERNIFFDPSRTKAVVVLNYIKSYEGQVKGVTARLWRDVAQKVYGASKVAVVSHTSLKNRAHLNQLLASQDLSEYIIEQP